jgi:hypothetical protein
LGYKPTKLWGSNKSWTAKREIHWGNPLDASQEKERFPEWVDMVDQQRVNKEHEKFINSNCDLSHANM